MTELDFALTSYTPAALDELDFALSAVGDDDVNLSVPAGHLVLRGHAPALEGVTHEREAPTGHLVLRGHAPTLEITENIELVVPTGHLVLRGHAPAVQIVEVTVLEIPAGHLVLRGHAPTIGLTENVILTIPTGHMVLRGHAPTVEVTDDLRIPTGHLILRGHAPAVETVPSAGYALLVGGVDVWGDVRADLGIRCERGLRTDTPGLPPAAGLLRCELRNDHGAYNPDTTPLRAGQIVRLYLDARPLWTGILDRPDQHLRAFVETVRLAAGGVFRRLTGKRSMSSPVFEHLRTDLAFREVLRLADWPEGEWRLDEGGTELRYWWLDEDSLGHRARDTTGSEGPTAYYYEGADGYAVWRNAQALFTDDRSTAVQAEFGDILAEAVPEASEGVGMVVNHAVLDVVEREEFRRGEVWSQDQTLDVAAHATEELGPRANRGEAWKQVEIGNYFAGTPWLQGAEPEGIGTLFDVIWAGSQFVACGAGGVVLTSPDGGTWTLRDTGTDQGIRSLAWTGSVLVATVDDSSILRSTDGGVSWTPVAIPGGIQLFSGIAADGSGQVIASGAESGVIPGELVAALIRSTDHGASWSIVELPDPRRRQFLRAVVWTPGAAPVDWIATGEQGAYFYSFDGASWLKASPWSASRFAIASDPTRAVVRVWRYQGASAMEVRLTSPTSATPVDSPPGENQYALAYHDGLWFSAGDDVASVGTGGPALIPSATVGIALDDRGFTRMDPPPQDLLFALDGVVISPAGVIVAVGTGGSIWVTERRELAAIELERDSGAVIPISLTAGDEDLMVAALQLVGVLIAETDSTEVRSLVDAEASVEEYDLQMYEQPTSRDVTQEHARELVDAIVTWGQDGRMVVGWTVLGRIHEETAAMVMDREIGDRVRVVLDRPAIDEELWIAHRADMITAGGVHRVRFAGVAVQASPYGEEQGS